MDLGEFEGRLDVAVVVVVFHIVPFQVSAHPKPVPVKTLDILMVKTVDSQTRPRRVTGCEDWPGTGTVKLSDLFDATHLDRSSPRGKGRGSRVLGF